MSAIYISCSSSPDGISCQPLGVNKTMRILRLLQVSVFSQSLPSNELQMTVEGYGMDVSGNILQNLFLRSY